MRLLAAPICVLTLVGCAVVQPLPSGPPPLVLRVPAPSDVLGSGTNLQPGSAVSGRDFRVRVPAADWRILQDDEVLSGTVFGILHVRDGRIITFAPVMLSDVAEVAAIERENMRREPGARAFEITVSPDRQTASFVIESWTVSDRPVLQSIVKCTVRRVPGKPNTPLVALGGWTPDGADKASAEFDAIVSGITYE